MQSSSRLAALESILLGSFDVHEAARVATAGKGYTPAAQPVSTREAVALEGDRVYRAGCR